MGSDLVDAAVISLVAVACSYGRRYAARCWRSPSTITEFGRLTLRKRSQGAVDSVAIQPENSMTGRYRLNRRSSSGICGGASTNFSPKPNSVTSYGGGNGV